VEVFKPLLSDHLSYVTIFHCSLGRSHKTGLTSFLDTVVWLAHVKGYLPNWTEELFTIVRCIETRNPVYLVKDDHGEILEGTFYAEELQKVISQD
jgi:hypothetical protein